MTEQTNARVITETFGKVLRLSLQAPPANCYSYEMMQQLDQVILEARFNDEVEVIV